MANGLNKVMLIGNIGKQPEYKQINNSDLLEFSVATTERFKSGDEYKEATEWHNVSLWGKNASALSSWLTSGMKVYVEGSIKTRSWEGTDGEKKYRTGITARNVIVLTSKGTPRSDSGNQGGNDDMPF